MKTMIGATIIALVLSATSLSALTINHDEGGRTAPYAQRFKDVARRGERVVIDGPCYSACTLVFSYVPLDRICATPRAVLGIHRFWWHFPNGRVVDDQRATMAAVRRYPKAVQTAINARGGYGRMPANSFWYLRGQEIGVKSCQ